MVLPIPPGATISELLEDRHISLKDFADRMEMPVQMARDLLQGRLVINSTIAYNLEKIFGVSDTFWLNLEVIYSSKLATAAGYY